MSVSQGRAPRRRGSAMIVSLVMVVMILGVATALLWTTSDDVASTASKDRLAKAGLFAVSGTHVALTELNVHIDLENGGGDPRIGYVIHGTENERVTVRLLDPATRAEVAYAKPWADVYELEIVAQSGLVRGEKTWRDAARTVPNFVERRYVAIVKKVVPFPSQAEAALAILGDPSKGRLDVKGQGLGANTLVGDGMDQADPTSGVPGLGIEGALIDNLKGKLDPSLFQGLDGNGALAVGGQPLRDPTLDFANMDSGAEAMAAYAQGLIDATAATTLADGKKSSPATYTLGTDPSSVTVIDATGGRDFKNVSVTGQGTLVIVGDVDFHDSLVNWTGDVFVIGSSGGNSSFLVDHSSTVTIDGGLYALGVNDRKVSLAVHGDNGTNKRADALIVNGPLVAIADRTSRSAVNVQLNSHDSRVTVNGYLGVFGDHVRFDAHSHSSDTTFSVNGSMVVATPDFDKKSKVDVRLADKVDINFNSVNYRNALAHLGRFLESANIPPNYALGTFLETAVR